MNLKEPEISIIVPVYNAAETLSRCLASITAQTYIDWELLLIDDGSIDESLAICKNIVVKDERVKVFSQTHKGVAAARNLALDNVKGKYICFIDADDTVESNYLETLYQYHDYDLVICGYFVDVVTKEDKEIRKEEHCPIVLYSLSSEDKGKLMPLFMSGMIHINCNKLLSTSLIQQYNIRYPSIPVNEDYLFMLDYLSHCHCIATVDKPLYHWFRLVGNKTGVDSMPDNLLEIYNLAHQKTRLFFGNNENADRSLYYSYCYLVQKYYTAYREGLYTKEDLKHKLSAFHSNEFVKSSFHSFIPQSKGELLLHSLLKYGLFNTYQWVTKKLSKWKS